MDDYVRDVYLHEVEAQCNFALNAIKGLNSVLARLSEAVASGDDQKSRVLHKEVFRSIHSFLTHTSNISRLLWPAAPRRMAREPRAEYRRRCMGDSRLSRGGELRNALGLPDHGHVLRSRQMRDHLEHFDERLDDWQASSIRHNYMQDCIGSAGAIAGIDAGDVMRWFDPATNCFRFRGEEYKLEPSVAAVEDIHQRVVAQLRARMLARLRPPASDAV